MRTLRIVSGIIVGSVAACGGSDAAVNSIGGSDSGTGDSSSPSDSGTSDATPASCDGGTVSCGGKCVDTSTDPTNCGGCGVVCNTQCTSGVCPLFGSGCDGGVGSVADNACITVDATNVYWASGLNGGSVWNVPIGGGCPSLVIGSQAVPHGMASDGATLFFADEGATSGSGSVQSIAIGGGSPSPVASSQFTPLDVVLGGTNVYWTNTGDGSLWKSDKTTPSPINLVTATSAGHATHLQVDSTYVYFTDHSGSVVNRVPIATGAVTAMTASGATNANFIAIDSVNAYFGAAQSGTTAAVMSIALNATAGTPSPIIPGLPYVNGIATDGTSLWYAVQSNVNPYAGGTGEIHRATVAGTSDTILASKQNGPNCIAVDATSVYWINSGGGMISKTGK